MQQEANLFLANSFETIDKWFVFMWVIIACTDVKWPRGCLLLCLWIFIKVSCTMSTCDFMKPHFRFMMVNLFCHSPALYPGQMRAPLFLAPRLFHFRDKPFLRELNRTGRDWGEIGGPCPVCCHRVADQGLAGPTATKVCRPLTMAPMTIMNQWHLGPSAFGHLVLSSHPKTFKIRNSMETLASWHIVSFCLPLMLHIPISLISPGNKYSAVCLLPINVCFTPKNY